MSSILGSHAWNSLGGRWELPVKGRVVRGRRVRRVPAKALVKRRSLFVGLGFRVWRTRVWTPTGAIDPTAPRSSRAMATHAKHRGGRRHAHGSHPTPDAGGEPERSLLDAIADGRLDDHLTAMADAVHARRLLLHTVRSATALASLCVGDIVRFNHNVSPRYLDGRAGTIVDVDDEAATVRLDRPVGRFHTGRVRCPPLALDKLAPAA
jgi:hypothetical protein